MIEFALSIISFLLNTPAVLVFVGLAIGAKAPDIDLAPVLFLRHRSAWTHGPLLPLAAIWAAGRWPHFDPLLIGLLIGLAVHLLADTFPRKWSGAALISFHPLTATLPPLASSLFIASAAVVSGMGALQLAGLLR